MSKEKPSISQVLAANRSFVMVLLGVPIIGMLIAVVLILYKRPESTVLALGVIFFIAVQYIIMMYLFMKRVESQARKKTEQAESLEKPVQDSVEDSNTETTETPTEQYPSNRDQLLTEEQRIFDTEKEKKHEKNPAE